jgi:uncharacterized membrane protein
VNDRRVSAPLPNTTTEAVTLLAHYYRGELARMISWRDRLDRTTNWAIGALAAMLSISLATEQAHHSVLLFAMLLIHVMLVIEARRYRFYHVYRARVRIFESRYMAEAMTFDENNKRVGLDDLAEGLRVPRFNITLTEAMSRRLRRNYCWIFLVVLLAWLVKTTSALLRRPGAARALRARVPGECVDRGDSGSRGAVRRRRALCVAGVRHAAIQAQ